MRAIRSRAAAGLMLPALVLLLARPARADFEKEQSEFDAMVAQRKYQSAAAYIQGRPDLMAQPRFLRRLSHVLVTYYTMNINFTFFAVKDLQEGERIEDLRGAPGTHQLASGDWEQVLFEAMEKRPADPDLNFAVGEYLSRGQACGCARPQRFVGAKGDEFPYFERAYRAGIFDYWSLFRMGVHHMAGDTAALHTAVHLFDESLKEKPDHVATHYNEAVAHVWLGEYALARAHSLQALGRYGNPALDADTYNVQARIELALGDRAAAGKAFARALELKSSHPDAFTGFLGLLRADGQFAEYKRRVLAFAALDFANTWPLGVYAEYVRKAGATDADREIARSLAARQYARDEEVGAVFYNLGRMAEWDGERTLAHARFRKSLEALKRCQRAPPGSIEALTELVKRTQPP